MKQEQDRLFDKAYKLAEKLIFLAGQPLRTDANAKKKLNQADKLLNRVIAMGQRDWLTYWLLGKVRQALGDSEGALKWLSRAFHLAPTQPATGLEAAVAAIELQKHAQAIRYCSAALAADPKNAGVQANLALAYLLSDKPHHARLCAAEALALNPEDTITKHLCQVIDKVIAGEIPCPRSIDDFPSPDSLKQNS